MRRTARSSPLEVRREREGFMQTGGGGPFQEMLELSVGGAQLPETKGQEVSLERR